MSSAIQILLPLVLILVAARLAGRVSQRVGMPSVLGELLAGVILGPALLNVVHMDESLRVLAELGVILLMFIAGVETDMIQMRSVGKGATLTAIGGVLLPLAAGCALAEMFGYSLTNGLFIGALLTATSVSISTQVLSELGQLKSRIGATILGAAVIDDVLGILVLSLVLSLGESGSSLLAPIQMITYFILAIIAGRLLVPPIARWVHRHHAPEVGLALILALVLVYAWAAEALGGLAAVTGAYLVGVMVGQIPEVKHWVVQGASHVGYGFFVPIFFVAVGLDMRPNGLGGMPLFTVLLIALAVLTKVVGCGLGARLGGNSARQSLIIGTGMVGRGEVALVMATVGLSSGRIDDAVFTAAILMTVVTTLATPILLKVSLTRLGGVRTPMPAPAEAGAFGSLELGHTLDLSPVSIDTHTTPAK